MILRTTIEWVQIKPLTEFEIAKREVLAEEYEPPVDEYEELIKEAVIDTTNEKIYIEIEPDKICMIRLLDANYAYNENGGMERIEERLIFKETLENIYNKLIQEQQINK